MTPEIKPITVSPSVGVAPLVKPDKASEVAKASRTRAEKAAALKQLK